MPRLIEGATLDHAGRIAPNLRLADRLEITRASGLDLLKDLKVQSTAPTWALRGPIRGALDSITSTTHERTTCTLKQHIYALPLLTASATIAPTCGVWTASSNAFGGSRHQT